MRREFFMKVMVGAERSDGSLVEIAWESNLAARGRLAQYRALAFSYSGPIDAALFEAHR